MDLQQMVLEELRVDTSYRKCWRARKMAVSDVHGAEEESYSVLAEYLHLLKEANPGTVTHIETERGEDGVDRFLYIFLAFGASISGFRNLRRLLVVDGTHLKGKYKGVLLTASGQDANFQVFLLAFAVVDSENDDERTWFFQKLEMIITDSKSLSIISDRHQSIYTTKKRIYPLAQHGAYIVHLCRNVQAKYKNKGLTQLVQDAAYEFKVTNFKEYYAKIKSENQACAKFLEKIGMAHWSRVYFQGERYNLMTSNIAESLNKALFKGRFSHIIELIRFIRSMLSRWFSARRKKSQKHIGLVPPEVDKELTKTMMNMQGSRVGNISIWSYEVVGRFGGSNHVLLDMKQCTCKKYDKVKMSCGHALLAANSHKVAYGTLVGGCYKTATWVATYSRAIYPEKKLSDVDIPSEIHNHFMLPPFTRRPSGRPKEIHNHFMHNKSL